MKCTVNLFSGIVIFFVSTSTALAAVSTHGDNSGIFVWIFLGFCALIVVAQLLPAMLVLFGLAKGLKKEKEATPETVSR